MIKPSPRVFGSDTDTGNGDAAEACSSGVKAEPPNDPDPNPLAVVLSSSAVADEANSPPLRTSKSEPPTQKLGQSGKVVARALTPKPDTNAALALKEIINSAKAAAETGRKLAEVFGNIAVCGQAADDHLPILSQNPTLT